MLLSAAHVEAILPDLRKDIHADGLIHFRRLTSLDKLSLRECCDRLKKYTVGDGSVTEASFSLFFRTIRPPRGLSKVENMKRQHMIKRLWRAIDSGTYAGKTGSVLLREVSVSMSALCSGTREEKAKIAFDFYVTDGSPGISLVDMISYIRSVFAVLYEVNPGTRERMGSTFGLLAETTAAKVCICILFTHKDVLCWRKYVRSCTYQSLRSCSVFWSPEA
jgi:hypothetical protein